MRTWIAWKFWRMAQAVLGGLGIAFIFPGALLLDWSDDCLNRRMDAKARMTKPIEHDPNFVKATRIE